MNKERAGRYLKQLSGDMSYYSYKPTNLPPVPHVDAEDDRVINQLLVDCSYQLGVLEGITTQITNLDLFISRYVLKEALLSSQIEGTQATLEDIFDPNNQNTHNADVEEVVNYIKATHFAIQRLETLPLCNRLLQETHAVLLSGVRGQEKQPGEFRRSQNWIGNAGSSLNTASYVPPCVDDMNLAMSHLERYMNDDGDAHHLIRAALIHYQFETIHPFLDGNGRIGRLLIVLYLLEKGVIKTPALYLSLYLKEHRVEYYDRMSNVRATGNYEQWVRFFLKGVYESCLTATETALALLNLHKEDLQRIKDLYVNERTRKTLEEVFTHVENHPIITLNQAAKDLDMSYNRVLRAAEKLEELGILKKENGNSRNKVYAYQRYLDILREGTEVFIN